MKQNKTDLLLILLSIICILGALALAYMPRGEVFPSRVYGMSVLDDPSGSLTREDVLGMGSLFKASPSSTVHRQRSLSAFWLRFSLGSIPSNGGGYLRINNTNLEDIRVYFNGREEIRTGKKTPVREQALISRVWYIPVPDGYEPGTPIYLRVQTNTNILIPVSFVSTTEMTNLSILDNALFAFFFGILFSLLIINIFSCVLLKNRNFVVYIVYLASSILYQLRVHGILYLVPMPFALYDAIVWLSLGAMGISLCLFAKEFMNLRKNFHTMDLLLDAGIVLFAIQTLVGVFASPFYAGQIAYVTGFIIPLATLGTAIYLFCKGHRENRFYLIACVAFVSGTIVWSTAAYLETKIPASYFFIFGTSTDSILFTLAIFDQLKKELSEKDDLAQREKYYSNLARTDSLTGLYNRQYLNELIKRLETDDELPSDTSMIMLDLDNFKSINDTYGHLIGDMLLTRTGTKIKKHIRRSDIACRYGGDEFLIVLPGADGLIAERIAEEIRLDLLNDISYSETGEEIHITTSIGITESRVEDSFDGMFLRADAALYQAKKTGRNKIAVL